MAWDAEKQSGWAAPRAALSISAPYGRGAVPVAIARIKRNNIASLAFPYCQASDLCGKDRTSGPRQPLASRAFSHACPVRLSRPRDRGGPLRPRRQCIQRAGRRARRGVSACPPHEQSSRQRFHVSSTLDDQASRRALETADRAEGPEVTQSQMGLLSAGVQLSPVRFLALSPRARGRSVD